MLTKGNEGKILAIRGVAEYLEITEWMIYHLGAAKKIPVFKLGGA